MPAGTVVIGRTLGAVAKAGKRAAAKGRGRLSRAYKDSRKVLRTASRSQKSLINPAKPGWHPSMGWTDKIALGGLGALIAGRAVVDAARGIKRRRSRRRVVAASRKRKR